MFGTRLINSTVVTAMMITFVLIMIVLFILFIKDIGRNIVSIIVIILGISMLIVMTGIKIYSKKQGTDNIKKAINDNYSNAENILIQFDRNTKNNKGYFTSEHIISLPFIISFFQFCLVILNCFFFIFPDFCILLCSIT